MKKVLCLVLALALALSLVACGGSSSSTSTPAASSEAASSEVATAEGYELAMITDVGEIDDKSFNQGTWEGIKAYADANGVSCQYYKPSEQSTDAYLAAIELAVKGGAKVVVTPGYLFEEPIYLAQDQYPDVNFVLIDGNPHNADYSEYRTEKNAVGITFAEEQAGYLAGYAAVKDGYTKLGFMGGMAVPAVIKFGYGFVQGAEAAATEMGVKVDVKYNYTGSFVEKPEIKTMAEAWYQSGTEIIFACGGKICNSVFAAAEANNGKTIGVDIDQAGDSETVVTSSTKGLAAAVTKTLEAYYAGKFPGTESWVLGAADDAVSLPMATSKFKTFTQADYDAVYAKLADGSITLKTNADAEAPTDLEVSAVKVEYVE
ncbi:MAG: BMP family ABC transporter substrate-binding protein [Oscillospiraceae bacterium]|nr:BMP family ABC transporter substrate-binding protein [Oscillospiraceae bacterium]